MRITLALIVVIAAWYFFFTYSPGPEGSRDLSEFQERTSGEEVVVHNADAVSVKGRPAAEVVIPKPINKMKSSTNNEADLEATLKWLKKLSPRQFRSWTLKDLKDIKELNLDMLNVIDSDLHYLKSLTSLTRLDLKYTKITDEGLKVLSSLTSLTKLNLNFNQMITDKGLKELSDLSSLTELYLERTHITDEGLKELSSLTSLTVLGLQNTKVTDEAVKKLQEALPNCRIRK